MIFENTNVKLTDICEDISYGYTASSTAEIVGPKFLRITDIQGGEVNWESVPYCEVNEKNFAKNKLDKGDIVVARTGNSTGENYIYDEEIESVFASYLIRFRVDESLANPYFVWLQMRSASWWNYVSGAKSGSAQAGANAKVLGQFEFFLPERKIQNQSVDLILNFNKIIKLNRQINQTLESMTQVIFKSWFVDFEPVKAKIEAIEAGEDPESVNRAAMRAISGKSDDELDEMQAEQPDEYAQLEGTAELFPAAMWDSELGEVPEGWEVGSFSDLAETNPESWTKKNAPQNVKYVDLSNVNGGTIASIKKFDFLEAPSRARRILRNGDSIIGTVRPGNKAFAYIQTDGLTGSTGFAVLRPRNTYSREFIYLNLTKKETIEYFSRIADGAAYPSIRPEIISEYKIIIPSELILKNFCRIVSLILIKTHINSIQNMFLSQIRDTLLPKLLSGELSVENIELDEANV